MIHHPPLLPPFFSPLPRPWARSFFFFLFLGCLYAVGLVNARDRVFRALGGILTIRRLTHVMHMSDISKRKCDIYLLSLTSYHWQLFITAKGMLVCLLDTSIPPC